MRFAVIDEERIEATPGLVGLCICCGAPTVAKCGKFKVWHWAHKSKSICDGWWESETDWHRGWKAKFPESSQEVIHFDALTNEKHIADVKIGNLVLEFQHSILKPEEMMSRESFYGDMVWIVDGCRSEFDPINFKLGLREKSNKQEDFSINWYSPSKLLHRWGVASKPVYLDFGGENLWQLINFDAKSKSGTVRAVLKDNLVREFQMGRAAQPDRMLFATSDRS